MTVYKFLMYLNSLICSLYKDKCSSGILWICFTGQEWTGKIFALIWVSWALIKSGNLNALVVTNVKTECVIRSRMWWVGLSGSLVVCFVRQTASLIVAMGSTEGKQHTTLHSLCGWLQLFSTHSLANNWVVMKLGKRIMQTRNGNYFPYALYANTFQKVLLAFIVKAIFVSGLHQTVDKCL